MATLYEEMVDAIDDLSGGPHAGHRAAHAKGTLCKGSFAATPAAAELSRAKHLAGTPVPVTARAWPGARPRTPRRHGATPTSA